MICLCCTLCCTHLSVYSHPYTCRLLPPFAGGLVMPQKKNWKQAGDDLFLWHEQKRMALLLTMNKCGRFAPVFSPFVQTFLSSVICLAGLYMVLNCGKDIFFGCSSFALTVNLPLTLLASTLATVHVWTLRLIIIGGLANRSGAVLQKQQKVRRSFVNWCIFFLFCLVSFLHQMW